MFTVHELNWTELQFWTAVFHWECSQYTNWTELNSSSEQLYFTGNVHGAPTELNWTPVLKSCISLGMFTVHELNWTELQFWTAVFHWECSRCTNWTELNSSSEELYFTGNVHSARTELNWTPVLNSCISLGMFTVHELNWTELQFWRAVFHWECSRCTIKLNWTVHFSPVQCSSAWRLWTLLYSALLTTTIDKSMIWWRRRNGSSSPFVLTQWISDVDGISTDLQ